MKAVLFWSLMTLNGSGILIPHDVPSLLFSQFNRSEVVGVVAGFGTTFAAVPDLVGMFSRRSSTGMHPRMAANMAIFQILWVYYGMLILSRSVVVWNAIAILINSLSVGAYDYFGRNEQSAATATVDGRSAKAG